VVVNFEYANAHKRPPPAEMARSSQRSPGLSRNRDDQVTSAKSYLSLNQTTGCAESDKVPPAAYGTAKVLTQIYEVSTPVEARAMSEIGVDHIGVLVGSGAFPRELPVEAVAKVAVGIIPPSKFSALFLTADISLIEQWARQLQPAIVHLGAAPELLHPEHAATLKRNLLGVLLMRSVPVVGEDSIAIARSYEGIADFLLLDSHRESDRQIGALGVTHDWSISRRIVELVRTPAILAGGLGPDNVAEAIRAVRPHGVDSKTKTDQDGSHRKDLDRVRHFHEAARAVSLDASKSERSA
jgi:phosphoribosylanthranilate isomerase